MTWKLEVLIGNTPEGQAFYDTEAEMLEVTNWVIPYCIAISLVTFQTNHEPGEWLWWQIWDGALIKIEGTEIP